MDFNFISHKIKNSDKVVLSNGPIKHNSIIYELKNSTEFIIIKNEEIILDTNWVIRTDHNGKVYEQWEKIEPVITEPDVFKLTPKEFVDYFLPIVKEMESKLINLSQDSFTQSKKPQSSKIQSEEKINHKKSNINILVSAICFINRNKKGAEIYATFANRLLIDVMNKTPYDFRIITNEPSHFEENKNAWGDRVIITHDSLDGEKLTVGPFNQLLKYKTMINVEKKYDWLLYLDCDAGFTSELDIPKLEKQIDSWETQGYDFLAARTNAVLRNELMDHEKKRDIFLSNNPGKEFNPWIHGGNLFSAKFIFYNISSGSGPVEWGDPSKWLDSKLPSEHVWLIKNNDKLQKCGMIFKSLNEKFESQSPDNLITWDMEAFEVGVSAKLAGYNMGELGNDGEFHILKIGFNFNNWEKVKY